jgi:hypothetical protein
MSSTKRQRTDDEFSSEEFSDDVDVQIEKLQSDIELLRSALKSKEEQCEELMKAKKFQFNQKAWFTLMDNEWTRNNPRVKSLVTNVDIKHCKVQEFFDKKNRIPGVRQTYLFHIVFNQELTIVIKGNVCFHKLGVEGQTDIVVKHKDNCAIDLGKMDLSINELEDYCYEYIDITMQDLLLIVEHIKYVFLSDKNSAPLRWAVDNASPWNKYETGLIESRLMDNQTTFNVDLAAFAVK